MIKEDTKKRSTFALLCLLFCIQSSIAFANPVYLNEDERIKATWLLFGSMTIILFIEAIIAAAWLNRCNLIFKRTLPMIYLMNLMSFGLLSKYLIMFDANGAPNGSLWLAEGIIFMVEAVFILLLSSLSFINRTKPSTIKLLDAVTISFVCNFISIILSVIFGPILGDFVYIPPGG
jgi:hypothetical protein